MTNLLPSWLQPVWDAGVADVQLTAEGPLGWLYAGGGALNAATGGKTAAPTLTGALFGPPGRAGGDNVISPFVGAITPFVPAPGTGRVDWQVPVFNPSGVKLAQQLLPSWVVPAALGVGAIAIAGALK